MRQPDAQSFSLVERPAHVRPPLIFIKPFDRMSLPGLQKTVIAITLGIHKPLRAPPATAFWNYTIRKEPLNTSSFGLIRLSNPLSSLLFSFDLYSF
jgi:hypothetical protein